MRFVIFGEKGSDLSVPKKESTRVAIETDGDSNILLVKECKSKRGLKHDVAAILFNCGGQAYLIEERFEDVLDKLCPQSNVGTFRPEPAELEPVPIREGA